MTLRQSPPLAACASTRPRNQRSNWLMLAPNGTSASGDQHGGVRIDAGRRRRHPGINVTRQAGSDVVTGGKNGEIADIVSAVIQPDCHLALRFADVDAGALHDREP